ncbi:S-layer homology domain-containing protein [Sporosarcina sp. GW1-11]|uniref:S-layer homology domain-containing protein n=1 Tax=Sporosarcina sp. GW1-11 TaxID=2899126 RepID=UPI00294F68BE|nr:S-layer homology domain-containing protein [Sporosarcina sp. GW1-11]MDV6378451.1 S-layer homology domain-containing protein [Sporosarcina sp. GW1-11]
MNKWHAMIILATLLFFCSIQSVSARMADVKYIDIPNHHWAKNEVMQLDEMKIITGDYDMQFHPDAPLTKGQVAVSLSKIFGSKLLDNPYGFSDVKTGSDKALFASTAVENGWLQPKSSGTFGFDDPMTEQELWDALVAAFELKNNGGKVLPKIWPARRDQVTLQDVTNFHFLTTEEFLAYGEPLASRAFFSKALHQLLVETNRIKQPKFYTLSTVKESANYSPVDKSLHLGSVPFDNHPLYIRSTEPFMYKDFKRINYGFSRDQVYTYAVGRNGAEIELTVRDFDNQDVFVFSKLTNPSNVPVTVDVLQKEEDVAHFDLYRFDRYPLMRLNKNAVDSDMTSYPTGVLRFIKTDGTVEERMIGQAYQSKQLSMHYDNDEQSVTRELLGEQENLSYAVAGKTLLSVYTLQANTDEVTDHWYVDSDKPLFQSKENIFRWMRETSQNHRKRNNWYTADGPYNKLAESTEPMPASGQNYGRLLLMLKEDRALTLYHEQKDRYFEVLVYNAFVNLKNFKKDKDYWETEVTSTYLKHLYDIHAPFIDTRFNEQIALFYYNIGGEFGIPSAKEPLRNYADLLVSQKRKGNTITVARDAYYIADYFPINQQVTTHTSMNHALGGMNILLMAYQEFGDWKYLQTARSIQQAIVYDKNKWIRDNGDIWYRISPDKSFKGDDYLHLTLEDLIDSYQLWQQVDASYLPTLKQLIISKAGFLSNEKLGYTTKIKKGLKSIGLSEYLPEGDEVTDAL